MYLETSLEKIAVAEIELEEEHLFFKEFIKKLEPASLDAMVLQLNNTITPQIDCTTCGNCCKSLMINVTEEECVSVSAVLERTVPDFKEEFIETSAEGQMIINTIPCKFLAEKKCTIYENRFTECRAFPHLDQQNFKSRINGTLMHYGRCLIIYNVMEALKKALQFKS